MDKFCIGVPYYGTQEMAWMKSMLALIEYSRQHSGLEYVDLLEQGSSATDNNRNWIVDRFLKTDADWLYWVDADNMHPSDALAMLYRLNSPLCSGLYYGKAAPYHPIAYYRNKDGSGYQFIDDGRKWHKGEIFPVDAVGMGACLTHRSVFEAIKENHVALQRQYGGMIIVHKSMISGEIKDDGKHQTDGKVINGQYRERLTMPRLATWVFPYFASEFGRTEDMWFFEAADRVGFKPLVDTAVEVGHLFVENKNGAMFRKELNARRLEMVRERETSGS